MGRRRKVKTQEDAIAAMEKQREYMRRYREKNREKINANQRKYEEENREKVLESKRSWLRAHPENNRANNERFRERLKEQREQIMAENAGRVFLDDALSSIDEKLKGENNDE